MRNFDDGLQMSSTSRQQLWSHKLWTLIVHWGSKEQLTAGPCTGHL